MTSSSSTFFFSLGEERRKKEICIFTHFRRRQNGPQTQTEYSDPKFIWTISYGQIDEACDDGNIQYDYLKKKKTRAERDILVLYSVHSLDSMVNMKFIVFHLWLYMAPQPPTISLGEGKGKRRRGGMHHIKGQRKTKC